MYWCDICDECYSTKGSLVRHLKKKHNFSIEPIDKNFICDFCGKLFSYESTLKRHILLHLPECVVPEAVPKKPWTCDNCGKSFTFVHNLKRHLKKFHNKNYDFEKRERRIVCKICRITFSKLLAFDDHLIKFHDFTPDIESKVFKSMKDFKVFKTKLEEAQHSFFVKQRTVRSKTYYACHRSGCYRQRIKSSSSRKMKWRKSHKIGATCPARIVLTPFGDGIKAMFQKNHFGHDCSAQYLQLSNEEKSKIALKIETEQLICGNFCKHSHKSSQTQNPNEPNDRNNVNMFENIVETFMLPTEIQNENELKVKQKKLKKLLQIVYGRVNYFTGNTVNHLIEFLNKILKLEKSETDVLANRPKSTSHIIIEKKSNLFSKDIKLKKISLLKILKTNKNVVKKNLTHDIKILNVPKNFDHTY